MFYYLKIILGVPSKIQQELRKEVGYGWDPVQPPSEGHGRTRSLAREMGGRECKKERRRPWAGLNHKPFVSFHISCRIFSVS